MFKIRLADALGRLFTRNNPLTVGGVTFGPISVEKTRPADTDNYVAGDAISSSPASLWVFPDMAANPGGSGVILAAEASTTDTAAVARLELDLYRVPPTTIADNAEATRLYADQESFVGTISFLALGKKTTNSTQAEAFWEGHKPFETKNGTSLFGILRTLDAYNTPASAAKVRISLFGMKD